jgi:hypothetical protein
VVNYSLCSNKYSNLKLAKATMGRGVTLRSDRDEPTWVVIHTYMETTQGISLYSSPYLKLAKMPCFCYFLLCFFFNKIEEQGGVSQIMYTHVSNVQMMK